MKWFISSVITLRGRSIWSKTAYSSNFMTGQPRPRAVTRSLSWGLDHDGVSDCLQQREVAGAVRIEPAVRQVDAALLAEGHRHIELPSMNAIGSPAISDVMWSPFEGRGGGDELVGPQLRPHTLGDILASGGAITVRWPFLVVLAHGCPRRLVEARDDVALEPDIHHLDHAPALV